MKTDLGPEYLHAEEFLVDGEWREFEVVVKEVIAPNTVKSADGKLITKGIIVVGNRNKRLVLGKTNERLMVCAMGTSSTKQWIGKKVKLYPVSGSWFGQDDVCAIRISLPKGATKPYVNPNLMGAPLTGQKQATWPQQSETDK